MAQFDRLFVDLVLDGYFEKNAYRWLAVIGTLLISFPVFYFTEFERSDWLVVLLFIAFSTLTYQVLVTWLDYTIGNARKLEDVIWQVDEVQRSTWSTNKSGPLLAIKLTEVRIFFPQRIEFIEIKINSPWVEKLTVGKQVRFFPKHRFSLAFPGWEKLYDIGPIWKKAIWRKTWAGNYICGVEEFPVRNGCWIGLSTCPGVTVQEAYQALLETSAPKQIPPLNDFIEEPVL